MNTNVTLDKIPYYNTEIKRTVSNINGFASLSDEDIANLSIKKANEEVSKSKTAKVQKALLPATIAGLIAVDIATKKGVSAKIIHALGSILAYGILFKSVDIAGNVIDKAIPKKNNESDSTGASALKFIGAIGGGTALYALATGGIEKGLSKLAKKFPHSILEMSENFKTFDKFVADSKFAKNFGKFISEPAKSLAQKLPKSVKNIKNYAAPIALGTYVLGSFITAHKLQNKQIDSYCKNVDDLLAIREDVKTASRVLQDSKQQYDKTVNKDRYTADASRVIDAADRGDNIDLAARETLDETLS